ncbi:hypothetical protein ACIBQ1_25025 [Nonomuraea sp. NPDC050153]|uniref:hypothetical protein n=1 Tax=Nonomuraea sp. NPDC050153 TaxID=3364359 RepID=UPI003792BEE9
MTTSRRRAVAVAAQLALMLSLAPALPALAHGFPEDSGNSWNSGNFRSKGHTVNSGNFQNANFSSNSNNTGNGGNIGNGRQCIVERGAILKGGC